MKGGIIGTNTHGPKVVHDRPQGDPPTVRTATDITEVRIGSKPFRIEWRKPEQGDLSGCIQYAEARIIIDPDCSEWDRREIILHECLHGILTHAGETSHNEQTVRQIGLGLAELFRSNPELVELLGSPLE